MSSINNSFLKGFEKTSSTLNRLGTHLAKHRKDYLMGAAAGGSVGTAYGANKGHKKTAGLPKWLHESHEKIVQSKPHGQSKRGLTGMMKRRGLVVGGALG